MTKFWSRVFAVNFAMGVATGIVMEFQFGTNWAAFSRYVGDVFGSALAAEGIFAFFLESGFLAVLVFGWDRVGKKMHFFATVMVALGSIFSAIWIVIANSWMHTPAGFEVVNGRAVITDFWAMVFNPSSMNRLVHVVLGAFIQGAFFVMSIAAYYILRNSHLEFAKRSFSIALVFGAVCCVLIVLSLGGVVLLWRGTLFTRRWLMWLFVVAVLGPIACNQAGWVAAEVGRQPFIIYPTQTVEWANGKPKVITTYEGLRTDSGL